MTTFPNPVRAIIFDMDGTLHDTEVVYHQAMKVAVEAVGFAISDAFCHSLIGIPGIEGDAMLRDHLGPDFPHADYVVHYRRQLRSVLASAVPLKAGAAELVDLLSGAGIGLAIATSADRAHAERHLALSGLRSSIPIVVTRSDVERGKPHPDLFLRAAELLGVPPGECLAVEDSLNGIRAAHAAGTMPVMVPDLLQPTDEVRAMCVHIAGDLSEVGVLLADLVRQQPRNLP